MKRDAFMELQRHAEERRRGAIVRESFLVCVLRTRGSAWNAGAMEPAIGGRRYDL